MGKRGMLDQMAVLKRTADNATARAREAEIERDELRRQLMLQARGEGDAVAQVSSRADQISTELQALVSSLRTDLDEVHAATAQGMSKMVDHLATWTKAREALGVIDRPGDDKLALEMKDLLDENIRLRRRLATAETTEAASSDAMARERLELVNAKETALGVLKAERQQLARMREIITVVVRRLPKNWREFGTPHGLAMAIAAQAPNLAMVVLADLLELLWLEYQRMQFEVEKYQIGSVPESASKRELEVKVGVQDGGAKRACFAVEGQPIHLPPPVDCLTCSEYATCVNEYKAGKPDCFNMPEDTFLKAGSPVPCELCPYGDDCSRCTVPAPEAT